MEENTSFEVFGYRTSSRFASHLKVSIDGQTVSVSGPRVGVTVYRLWIALQAIFFALTVPALITAIVLWNWVFLVVAAATLLLYWVISSVGAVALWEYQTLMSFEHGGYQSTSFPISSVKRVKIGRGWARNGLWLLLLPFVAGLNKASEGRAVSFEAPDGETGKDAVYTFYTSIKDDPYVLTRLLEGK
ncbi:MAG: hypothetical protein JSU58_05300 [Dehalococcoidales bacterium]|nr:MAG: hypothetical protein JSU58_05300 [Dehalococcoidales bacterium]